MLTKESKIHLFVAQVGKNLIVAAKHNKKNKTRASRKNKTYNKTLEYKCSIACNNKYKKRILLCKKKKIVCQNFIHCALLN